MIDLRSAARALEGEVCRNQVLFPAPGHSRRDRSAAVRFDPRAPNGFLVHSFAGEDPIPLRDYVRGRLGLRANIPAPSATEANLGRPPPGDADRTARALAIWDASADPYGTPVEAYLRRRGLELPDDAGEVIRFHPACPFAGGKVPAMVALVRDVGTNAPKAVHRTALTLDGRKALVNGKDRLALGPIGGGAVKLTADAEVTTCLGVGEGIESTLSLRQVPEFGSSPVWALLSAGGLEGFPALPGIECLHIAVDHDEAGLRASRTAGSRWQSAGAEVFLIKPSAPQADLNDILQGAPYG